MSTLHMFTLPGLLLLPCLSNQCIGAEALFESRGEESIRITRQGNPPRMVTEHKQVNFHSIRQWGDGRSIPNRNLVVRETRNTRVDEGLEGSTSRLKAEVFVQPGDKLKFPGTPAYVVEVPGAHDTRYETRYWEAITRGCCDQEDYSRYYTYSETKPFLQFNDNCWKVEAPNAPALDRFVGMALRDHVPGDDERESLFGGQPSAVARLTLASEGKTLDVLYLGLADEGTTDPPGLHSGDFEIVGNPGKDQVDREKRILTAWSLDGAMESNRKRKDSGGYTVRRELFLTDGTTAVLTVRVDHDRFKNPSVAGKLRLLP